MKLGFHSATTMTSDLATDVAASAYAGFTALELWAEKVDRFLGEHPVEGLKALLGNHKVAPLSFNSIEFIAFRGDEYQAVRARCLELCRLARAIGCPTVVVVASPTPSRTIEWHDVVQEYVGVLRDLSAIAGEHGVTLAFESLGFGWCSVRTPRAAWEIVQETDRQNVGLVIDCAHFYGGGGLLRELETIDPRHIFCFHLNDMEDVPKEAITDARRLIPGQGVIPLAEICARLQGIGYNGPCSIELFRPTYWEWDPREVAVKTRQAAVEILSPYFVLE